MKRLLFSAALFFPWLAHAATLSLTPSPINTTLNSTFQVSVILSGLPDIVGFDLDIAFPSFLTLNSVIEDGYFAANGVSFTPGAAGPGSVTGIADVLTSPGAIPDPDTLVVLTFLATGAGTGTISFTRTDLVDSSFNFAIIDQLNDASVTVDGGAQIPEPAAVFSTALGLSAMWWFARRRSTP